MTSTEALKQEIISRIQGFSEEQLRQITDYINMLGYKPQSPSLQKAGVNNYSPLHEYIGGISHGKLAEDIDKELYG